MSVGNPPAWALYDDVTTGHHMSYVSGVAKAFAAHAPTIVATTFTPPETVRWIPTRTHSYRRILGNRRQLNVVARRAREMGATRFVDLFFDKNVWAASDHLDEYDLVVHVLHHTTQYLTERGGTGALSGPLLRRRVRHLTGRNRLLVVHTEHAARVMEPLVAHGRLVIAPYPIDPPISSARHPDPSRIELLFAGSARREKGFDLLVDALASSEQQPRLTVVGRQRPGTRDEYEQRYPKLEIAWSDGFVPDGVLREAYARCSLAVLPYRSSFGAHGGPSSVLLEALAHGAPILTTMALADQLPPSYGGAIITEPDSMAALAAGLEAALSDLTRLDLAARSAGPDFVRSRHSYAGYVAIIVRAAGG
jgi:glycosyltransferase involved in cell wall biosynthesis